VYVTDVLLNYLGIIYRVTHNIGLVVLRTVWLNYFGIIYRVSHNMRLCAWDSALYVLGLSFVRNINFFIQ
jgi:hypothetical protein